MAIKVFEQDKKEFQKFKIGILYLDLHDNLIEQLKNDFLELKMKMYSQHHLDVKYMGKHDNKERYSINNTEIVEYTPAELKELTSSMMEEYIYKDKTRIFKRKERVYPN
ncbi:hypothetical protein [Paucisalibacillus globulus]|uniref:hypothetical protein n=1 Tax=Paucisalibacillus globulus TaxID=351095 RepID=UPI000BB79FAD|nr:hypothetical protein [Paucisalibacillus globulus]